MACCKCCCEGKSSPGVCCGIPGSCCDSPRVCCSPLNDPLTADAVCCEEGEVCCEGVCAADCQGACCGPDNVCGQNTPEGCAAISGTFMGVGTTCTPDPCACDPACTGCSECVAGNCVSTCQPDEFCCDGVCQATPCEPPCDPPCDGCSDCIDGGCVSSCAPGENCCGGVCQSAPCAECDEDADCTPPPGASARCCDGVCKNTIDDVGYCRDADTGECYVATFDDCQRANQSNTFDLCSCPAAGLWIMSTGGVGTELKKLLGRIGIVATPNCKCNARAKLMDERGIPWCENNVETICDWLQEEAANRKLPFLRAAGKALIYMAIRRAKKNTSK